MSTKIEQLVEKRTAAHKAASELNAKESMTADEKALFEAKLAEVNQISKDIETQKQFDAQDAELRKVNTKNESAVNVNVSVDTRTAEEKQKELELRAIWKFGTNKPLDADEAKVMEKRVEGTSTGSAGYLIPPAFQYNLEVAMKYYAPFLEYADVIETADGAPMTWPLSSDVTNECQLVAEGDAITDTDIGVTRQTFGAFKFGSLIKVGMEISQDSFTNVDGLVADAFAIRFGRGLSRKFTVGVGSTEPTGIVTAATAGPTVTGDDNQTSPNPLTQVGYFDLLALLHSVDKAYRDQPGAAFMLNDTTLLAVQKLKDKFGRPLWQPGLTSDAPAQILGKPYIVNNFMDDIGANKKPVLFGDLSRYKVRKVKAMTIQRLVERYAEFGQVGIIAWARYDGNLLDAGMHPVKYLVCPAS